MKIKSGGSVCAHCGYDETVQNEMHQLAAGTVLKEQYLIGRVLGQGGFGITYLGWDLYLDIPVAIKEYFPSGTVMRETSVSMEVVSYSGEVGARFRNNKERFLREAKMLARFSEVPEIVQIKNFFLANNTAYIVMEYVDGITLKQYVKNQGGRLSVKETLALMQPVIQALGKVHKAGIVHRDISPDNIMMLPNGKIKILDFGAVRDVGAADVEHPLTKSTEAILKQGYAPIEQYQNHGSLGPWTDVYALCATMFYCLTGSVPPDAPERLLGEEEIDFKGMISSITEQQAEALKHGMMLRAQDRIASMEDLHQELYVGKNAESRKQEDTGKTVPVKPVAEKKTACKNPRSIAILVLVIVAITLAIGIGISGGNGEPTVSEGIEWTLEDGILTITGEGAIPDYNARWMEDHPEEFRDGLDYAPWADRIEEIEYLILGEGITSIGENAFADAVNLKEVEWSPELQTIRWMAFSNTGLESVNLPYTVESIEHFAFNNCSQLKNVDLPYRLSKLEAGTFMQCEALENVAIRPYTNVETNADGAGRVYTPFSCDVDGEYVHKDFTIHTYKECSANTFAISYDIYHEYIHDGMCGEDVRWTFDGDTKTLTLEGTGQTWCFDVPEEELEAWRAEFPYYWIYCPEMPDWWYSFREDIETIVVGDGITHLNWALFSELPNLKNVDLGNVELIDCLFRWCSGLEEIVVPETVTHIGACSFIGCKNLKKVEILADDATLWWDAFSGADNLEEVHFGKNAKPAEDGIDLGINKNATLYVHKNSGMHKYAQRLGYNFVIIEE